MQAKYDIIIVGGGMAGSCLALALASTSLRIAVIEAAPLSRKQNDDAGKRAIALSWGSRCLLKQLNVWNKLQEAAAIAIKQIHISDQGCFGKTRLSAAEQKVDALGYVVEAVKIEAALSEKLATLNVDMICPAELLAYTVNSEGVEVTIKQSDGESSLFCQLIVGADGGQSVVASLAGLERCEQAYNQQAITALIQTESEQQHIAYERFTAEGPIAMLPHVTGAYSLVWAMPPTQAKAIMSLSNEAFASTLQAGFGHWLGALSIDGPRQCFPLNLSYVRHPISDRVVLIGNAAQQLHPIAGQGFNLGLRDAALLADVVRAKWGEVAVNEILEAYAERRKVDKHLVVGFTDKLVKTFSTSHGGVSFMRNSGLLLIDKLPVLKNQLAKQAMGLATRLARLKKG